MVFVTEIFRSVKIDEIEDEVSRVVSEVHQIKFEPISSMDHKRGAVECRNKLATIYHLA